METRNGVVTLTGNADSEEANNRALEPERTVGETVDDTGITITVKRRLLDDPQVKGLRIDVDTREGVDYLTGSVGSDLEREKAIQLARDTNGVRDVRSNLTLKKS